MKALRYLLMVLALVAACLPARAMITGELIMLRSPQPFDKAMENLVSTIEDRGYTVVGVRRVDAGLARSGYKTSKYRVVFFEKKDEFAALSKRYPEMLPYLPLKIVIFAEAGETLLVTSDPVVFIDLYPDPRLRERFRRWHDEVIGIMEQVRNTSDNRGR